MTTDTTTRTLTLAAERVSTWTHPHADALSELLTYAAFTSVMTPGRWHAAAVEPLPGEVRFLRRRILELAEALTTPPAAPALPDVALPDVDIDVPCGVSFTLLAS